MGSELTATMAASFRCYVACSQIVIASFLKNCQRIRYLALGS